MAKAKTVYVCTECGGQALKWQGQCPHCQAWNTLVESVAETAAPSANRFSLIAETGRLVGMDLVEVNPILDVQNQTASLAVEFALSALGSRVWREQDE